MGAAPFATAKRGSQAVKASRAKLASQCSPM
jgi:hypothetical protein